MSSEDRQQIRKVRGARRAKLTAAPGTSAEPVPADEKPETTDAPPAGKGGNGASGPNDERLRRDVPPHY